MKHTFISSPALANHPQRRSKQEITVRRGQLAFSRHSLCITRHCALRNRGNQKAEKPTVASKILVASSTHVFIDATKYRKTKRIRLKEIIPRFEKRVAR